MPPMKHGIARTTDGMLIEVEFDDHVAERCASSSQAKAIGVAYDGLQAVLDDLSQSHKGVLSTGGGSVLREANRRHLHERGHVIYLRTSPEDVFRRVRHDTGRPLLQVDDPLGRLRALYEARDPLYRETAHYVIETGRPSVAALVNKIMMQLELGGHLPLAS